MRKLPLLLLLAALLVCSIVYARGPATIFNSGGVMFPGQGGASYGFVGYSGATDGNDGYGADKGYMAKFTCTTPGVVNQMAIREASTTMATVSGYVMILYKLTDGTYATAVKLAKTACFSGNGAIGINRQALDVSVTLENGVVYALVVTTALDSDWSVGTKSGGTTADLDQTNFASVPCANTVGAALQDDGDMDAGETLCIWAENSASPQGT